MAHLVETHLCSTLPTQHRGPGVHAPWNGHGPSVPDDFCSLQRGRADLFLQSRWSLQEAGVTVHCHWLGWWPRAAAVGSLEVVERWGQLSKELRVILMAMEMGDNWTDRQYQQILWAWL